METLSTLESMPVSDRLLIRNLFKKDYTHPKHPEYLDRKLYLNAGYTGVISSHDRIETNITQLRHEYDCGCGGVRARASKPEEKSLLGKSLRKHTGDD